MVYQKQSYSILVWRRFKQSKASLFSLTIVIFLILISIFADFISPNNPTQRNPNSIYSPPTSFHFQTPEGKFSLIPYIYASLETFDMETMSVNYEIDYTNYTRLTFFTRSWSYKLLGISTDFHLIGTRDELPVHFFGTDGLGRDVFSRCLKGSQVTLLLAFLVVTFITIIGTTIGMISAYYGGRLDTLIQRIVEITLAFPELPLYMALISVLPKTASSATIFFMLVSVLSLLKWAQLSREIRGKTLSLKSIEYVKAAESVGATDARIIRCHILPNLLSHIIVIVTISIPNLVLIESFLSFLGLGIRQPQISWGYMLNATQNFQIIGSYPWMLTPVLFILLTVLGFNALGDALRDSIDPYVYKK